MWTTEGHINILSYFCTKMRRNATMNSGGNACAVPEVAGTRYGTGTRRVYELIKMN